MTQEEQDRPNYLFSVLNGACLCAEVRKRKSSNIKCLYLVLFHWFKGSTLDTSMNSRHLNYYPYHSYVPRLSRGECKGSACCMRGTAVCHYSISLFCSSFHWMWFTFMDISPLKRPFSSHCVINITEHYGWMDESKCCKCFLKGSLNIVAAEWAVTMPVLKCEEMLVWRDAAG